MHCSAFFYHYYYLFVYYASWKHHTQKKMRQDVLLPCVSCDRFVTLLAATFQTLVVALVHSRLDYGNSVQVGIPVYLMRRLQSVLNAAARLICHLRRSDRISDAQCVYTGCVSRSE